MRRATWVLFGPALGWAALSCLGLLATWGDATAWGPVDRRGAHPVGSAQCLRCHPAEHGTWHDSFHRTMTQSGLAAAAPFAGETLDYLGFRATMTRSAAGIPHLTMQRIADDGALGERIVDVDVELAVGSHRYQQYVARFDHDGDPNARFRLPVAWHLGAQRWIPMGAAFLTPEGVYGEVDDALRHVTPYDDNCIFCHNTEPAPGRQPDGGFRPRMAELGVACEACHGPASAHVERYSSPLRRLLADVVDPASAPEGSILHPGRISPARHADVCGRCHGQRIGRDIDQILTHGDGYLPGTDLSAVSRPIERDSKVGDGPAGQFAERFWPDGTPRLSAYEYQALRMSACFDEGRGLTCGSCHVMHGPNPDMQLSPGYVEARVCAECHPTETLSAAAEPGGHGGHGEEIDCADCHRPRVTYGLVQGMRSHRITVPDPLAAVGRTDTPDACTQCHVDRSAQWAATRRDGVGGRDASVIDGAAGDPLPRVAVDLLGGDPIQRALATDALRQPKATLPVQARAAWLVDALEDDYPAIRFMAWRALTAVVADGALSDARSLVAAYDPVGDPAERIEAANRLRARLGPGALHDDPRRVEVVAARADSEIWIGE
jgi:hypothetical protein